VNAASPQTGQCKPNIFFRLALLDFEGDSSPASILDRVGDQQKINCAPKIRFFRLSGRIADGKCQ